jgi:hypothetical protein
MQTLAEMIARRVNRDAPASLRDDAVLRSEAEAWRLLSSWPGLPNDDPILINAVVPPKPMYLSVQWMEEGFRTVGVYLQSEDGRVVEVRDARVFREQMRDYYQGLTVYRTAAIEVRLAEEGSGGGRPAPGPDSDPLAFVPPGFLYRAVKVGMIKDDGRLMPPQAIIGTLEPEPRSIRAPPFDAATRRLTRVPKTAMARAERRY